MTTNNKSKLALVVADAKKNLIAIRKAKGKGAW
jgi:hypothetical protein